MENTAEILDQFTRQAEGFAKARTTRNEDVVSRMLQTAQPGPEDSVLDVACGPGVVTCAFAGVARHATGIDLTPAMLEQARKNQDALSLSNVAWDQGDVTRLPYADGQFDIVTCRFAFHHFPEPLAVLKEMARVCRSGGRVVVTDCSPEESKADAYDQVERLRDPSHTRALPPKELASLFAAAGLSEPSVEALRLPDDLDSLLAHSFPREEEVPCIRALFEQAMKDDFLDMRPVHSDGKVLFSFPIAIFAAQKAA
jgi:ubiquinone/menaquinone biosynthesis C-methylase UbiE